MSDSPSKGLPPVPKPVPEGNDFGTPAGDRRGPEIDELNALMAADRAEADAATARANAARKTTPLGRRSRRKKSSKPNLPRKEYERLATAFIVVGDTLRRDFAEAITGNLRGFRGDALRLLAAQLPLKRGRPRDPQLDALSRRLHQGEPEQDILRSQIANFDTMQPFERDLLVRGLHAAANRRRPKPRKGTRNKSRKRSCNTPPAIPPPDHPVN